MSTIDSKLRVNRWFFVSADPQVDLVLEGQFQPEEGAEYGKSANFAESSTLGSDVPTSQFVNAGAGLVKLRSSFTSRHLADDIRPRIERLDALDRKDLTLGRPPRITFTWGTISITGWARVTSKKVTGFWPITGLPMSVVFDVEVTEAEPLDFTTPQPSGETQFVTLAAGETFETLGSRYYGDPLLGELIRRENPAIAASETTGDRVKVLERDHPRAQGPVFPTSPALLDRDRSEGTWQPIVAELAASRGVDSPGLPWELLPDVLDGSVALELGED